MDLIRKGRFADQILRSAHRQIRKGMRCCIEHFGVARKVALENLEKIEGVRRVFSRHRAVNGIETRSLLCIAVGDLVYRFPQERQRFGAMSAFGEIHGASGKVGRAYSRTLLGSLPIRNIGIAEKKGKSEKSARIPEHHKIIHANPAAGWSLPALEPHRWFAVEKKWQAPKRLPFPWVLRWKLRI